MNAYLMLPLKRVVKFAEEERNEEQKEQNPTFWSSSQERNRLEAREKSPYPRPNTKLLAMLV